MNISSDGPWIPLCCEPGKLYPLKSICYQNDSFTANETIFQTIFDSNLLIANMSQKDFVPRYGISCKSTWSWYAMSNLHRTMEMFMFENGTIYLETIFKFRGAGIKYLLDIKDYCFAYNPFKNESALIICDTVFEPFNDILRNMGKSQLVKAVMAGLALPFLAATFIVYTILPELRNIHGLILRVYIACLFLARILSIAMFTRVADCTYAIGVTMHFLLLAVFFWLNVMCFDIWWTFRRCKPLQDRSKRLQRRKFIFYSIYAWGCPALFAGVGWIIESLPTVPQGIIRPGFNSFCWFSDILATAIYFDAPLVITLISNLCFFVSTSIRMIQHKRKMAQQFQGNNNRWQNDEKQRFKLYLKLFIIMGISRSYQFALARLPQKLPNYVTFFVNLPTMLEGLTIFIIFVWKKKIKQLLLKHLGWEDSFCSRKSTSRAHHLSESNTGTTTTLREGTNISSERSEPVTDETNI